VGRFYKLRVIAALLLVGGGAVAQQGLIVEPWRKPLAPTAAPLTASSAHITLPASGLPPDRVPPAPAKLRPPALEVAHTETKWTPPVVPLLVDPWAKTSVVAVTPRRRWLPQTTEMIIDPWAAAARPRAAAERSRGAGASHSTIF
jgi:hypothetical protein